MTIPNLQEKRREVAINKLLDVYIQDPMKNCGYLIKAEILYDKYLDNGNNNSADCITFVIPDPNEFALTNPISNLQSSGDSSEAAIKIFDGRSKKSFIIPRNELNNYLVDLDAFNPHGISFVMPIASDLVEELPAMMRGLLQSGEHPVIVVIHHKKDVAY